MSLPADFVKELWPDPLMFQGLCGVSCAGRGKYSDLFRADGFCKPLAELRELPWAAAYIDEELAGRAAWKATHDRPLAPYAQETDSSAVLRYVRCGV